MAQNNGLIIGIIAVLVVGGVAWYFLNNQQPNPTPGITTATFTDGFTQIQAAHSFPFQQMDSTYFTRMLDMTDAELQTTRTKIQPVHDSLVPQSNDIAYRLSKITMLILALLDATAARQALTQHTTTILALQLDEYCANIPLFQQRDQAGEQLLQELDRTATAMNAFVIDYPSEATQIGLTANSLDYVAFRSSIQAARESTQSLQQTCTGGI